MTANSLVDPTSLAHQNPTLLNKNVASMISSVSTATRFSIRISALIMEIIFETAKHSTLTTMSLSRRALIATISSARSLHLTKEEINLLSEDEYFNIVDRCTNLGVYVVHHAFTLSEMFAMGGFHFFSNSFKNGLWAAEESVRVLDGLFGSNETSRALASFVLLVKREVLEDDNFSLGQSLSCRDLISCIAKALTAFVCLQAATHKRRALTYKSKLMYKVFVPVKSISSTSQSKEPAPKRSYSDSKESTPSGSPLGLSGAVNSKKQFSTDNFSETNRPRTRRSKSFSFPSGYRSSNDTVFSSGLVELINQSSDLGKNNLSHVGDQTILRSDFDILTSEPICIKKERSSNPESRSSPPISPIPTPFSLLTDVGMDKGMSTDFIPSQGNFIQLLNRFMRYSSAAYGSHFMRMLGIGTWEDGDGVSNLEHHPNHYSFSHHTTMPLESILFSSFSSVSSTFSSGPSGFLEPPTLHPIVHYVAVDHGIKAVVLTCRGTLGISDALTDLACEYETLEVSDNSFKAHSGMLTNARQMADARSEIHKVIREALETHPGYGLVLCGHSLGGGVISLLGLLLSEPSQRLSYSGLPMFVTSEHSQLPAGRYVHCFAYGVPPVLNIEGSLYSRGLITSVVRENDVVPCLSLGSVLDFKSVVTSMSEEKDLVQLIITRSLGINERLVTLGTSDLISSQDMQLSQVSLPSHHACSHQGKMSELPKKPANDDWFWSLIKTLRADMQCEKLCPPGEVFIMDSKTTLVDLTKTRAFTPDSQRSPHPNFPDTPPASSVCCLQVTIRRCDDIIARFSEITFSRNMFSDHSPRAYEEGLNALATSLA